MPLNDRIAVGLALSSPFSLTTDYHSDSWTRYIADRTRLVLALGVLSFGLNALLDQLLLPMGIWGLALSTTSASFLIAVASLYRLAPELPRGSWRAPGLVLGSSVALAGLATALGFAPGSIVDLQLWAAAAPFLALLAIGVRSGRA